MDVLEGGEASLGGGVGSAQADVRASGLPVGRDSGGGLGDLLWIPDFPSSPTVTDLSSVLASP
jgi:hypothetical protein